MNNSTFPLSTLIVVALVTMLTRALPYLLLGHRETLPKTIVYLGQVLPQAIMVILVIYCLRETSVLSAPYGLPEIISITLIAVLQYFKRNTFLSVFCGVFCYMVLIRIL